MHVELALTPDLGLLSAVEGAVSVMAAQLGFEEVRRRTLLEGVAQACRRAIKYALPANERQLQLRFSRFADRLEIMLENGGPENSSRDQDAFLLTQLVDRVTFEELGRGRERVTLIQYLSEAGGQS